MVISRAPEAPSGWPSAIAPPRGLSRSSRHRSAAAQASGTGANASLTSMWSKSAIDIPVRGSTFSVAGIGAGEHRDRVVGGDRERVEAGPRRAGRARSARSSLMIRRALAPSVSWEELPAVTHPLDLREARRHLLALEGGRQLARPSTRRLRPDRLVGGHGRRARPVLVGNRDRDDLRRRSRPWRRAACERGGELVELVAAELPAARRSAPPRSPAGRGPARSGASRDGPYGVGPIRAVHIGTRLIDSTPPATTTS